MNTAIQLMMGTSVAACVGMRAWLPMLVVGLLARYGYIHLNPSYAFLMRTDALILFGVGAVLEILGDKVIAIDHLLDAVGTVVRPIVGTMLASSMLTHMDPVAALALGLVMGGGTSFTIHSGKALLRAKSTVAAPLHAGVGNFGLSVLEDVAALCGLILTFIAPVAAFILTVLALIAALFIIVTCIRTGTKLLKFLQNRRKTPITDY